MRESPIRARLVAIDVTEERRVVSVCIETSQLKRELPDLLSSKTRVFKRQCQKLYVVDCESEFFGLEVDGDFSCGFVDGSVHGASVPLGMDIVEQPMSVSP